MRLYPRVAPLLAVFISERPLRTAPLQKYISAVVKALFVWSSLVQCGIVRAGDTYLSLSVGRYCIQHWPQVGLTEQRLNLRRQRLGGRCRTGRRRAGVCIQERVCGVDLTSLPSRSCVFSCSYLYLLRRGQESL